MPTANEMPGVLALTTAGNNFEGNLAIFSHVVPLAVQ